MLRPISTFAVLLALVAGCGPASGEGAVETSDDALSVTTGTFVHVRKDTRRCAAPACGGFFVSPVERSTMRCQDGSTASSCYAATIDWSAIHVTAAESAALQSAIGVNFAASPVIVRATLASGGRGQPAKLKVTEAWRSPDTFAKAGTFYRVVDSGVRCTRAPCPSLKATVVNGSTKKSVHTFDVSGTYASVTERAAALSDAATVDGVLAVGTLSTSGSGSGAVTTLVAKRFFRRVVAAAAQDGCGSDVTTVFASATAGMLYPSESDYPFQTVLFPGEGSATPARLLQLTGQPANSRIETRTFAELFAQLTTVYDAGDPVAEANAAKFRALKAVLEQHLTNLRVIRTGEIQVQVFIVGTTPCGELAGVRSVSIET